MAPDFFTYPSFSFFNDYRSSSRCSLRFVFVNSRLYIDQNNLPNALHLWQAYDVTPFLDDHPGGDEVLVTATGNYFILVR